MTADTQGLRLAGAVLAGGRALRYGGRPKGLLEITPGVTILERTLREMGAAGVAEIAISANDPEPYRRFGRAVVPDLRPGGGPLCGVEAVLARHRGRSDATLFLPCDLPGITRGEVSALAENFRRGEARVVVAETGLSFWHSLCIVVHNDVLDAVTRALDERRLRVRDLWRALGARPVPFEDAVPFFNVNAPEDLAQWRAKKGEKACS